MKSAYPVILTHEDAGYSVYIPDFDANTQGKDLPDAIEMARDAIGLMGIDMEDDHKTLPVPSQLKDINYGTNAIVSLVDVDFDDYRRRNEQRIVKKNCSLPSWLAYAAEKANINFSQTLQSALKQALNIADN